MTDSTVLFQELLGPELKHVAYFLDQAFIERTLKKRYELIALQLVPLIQNEEHLEDLRDMHEKWSTEIATKYATADSRENLLKDFDWGNINNISVIYELFLQIAFCWQEEALREDTGYGLPSPDSWRVQRCEDYDLRDLLRYRTGSNIMQVRSKEYPNQLQQGYLNLEYDRLGKLLKDFVDLLSVHMKLKQEHQIYSIELKLSDSHNALILVVKKSKDDIGHYRIVRSKLNDSGAPQKYFIKSFEEMGNKVDVRDWGKSQSTSKIWGKKFSPYIGELFFQKVGFCETVLKRKEIILKTEPDINISKLKKEIAQLAPDS